MFKSIFTKYITAFILIMIVSFTVLSVIVGMMMASFYTETNKKTLASRTRRKRRSAGTRVRPIKTTRFRLIDFYGYESRNNYAAND